MSVVIVLVCGFNGAFVGYRLRLPAGVLAGTIVGVGGAVAIIVTVQAMVWLAASYLLARLVRYDRVTAVFSAAPGGMSDVISAAGSAGANTTVVAFTHLVRFSAVILVVPVLVALILDS